MIRGRMDQAADNGDLRETLDRAFQSGARLLENRVRLVALDAKDDIESRFRGITIIAFGVLAATMAWFFLMGTLAAALWGRLPPEVVFGSISALHVIATAALLLSGRNRLEAARRTTAEQRAAKEVLHDGSQG